MLIETHKVAMKKLSSYYSTNHKTKGWDKLDPIANMIYLTAGFYVENLREVSPKILKKASEAQTGAQMRSYFQNSFKSESLSCSTGMC